MTNYQLTYTRFSEASILVQWPQKIAPEILADMLAFKNNLLNSEHSSILQITNAYSSILITYRDYISNFESEITFLKTKYASRQNLEKQDSKLWKIPACYDSHFALDLEEISNEKQLSPSEIIKLHVDAVYNVYFIGFLPGFLYLGGLNERLFMPRKKSPRQHVEKGAVAIGGEQTGVYPNASPGGWNIIGNSPLNFFNIDLETPCFATAGDHIQFVAVDFKTHQEILVEVQNGTYSIESEVADG